MCVEIYETLCTTCVVIIWTKRARSSIVIKPILRTFNIAGGNVRYEYL